jgi:hypothetical protein
MRRLVAALSLSGLLLAGLPSTSGAEPWAGASADQAATADWLVKSHGNYTAYEAGAGNYYSHDGLITYAYALKGKCFVDKGNGWVMISCGLTGKEREIDPSRFQFDPQLGSASVKWGGNDLRWTGRGDTEPNLYESGSTNSAFGDAGLARDASVKGTVLGQKMTKMGRWDSAYLAEGASLAAFTLTKSELTRGPNGRLRAHVTYRKRV